MSTQFNPQQQQAIDALGQNVIVSASAGAGKTTVLIARLMKRILNDGVRIDEICAMTFTEAAASEMKTRLLSALNLENQSNPSDFLNEQIALVETASISTIHSFCLNIIKNYGYIIGLNPKRSENILSPAEANLMQKQAMEITLNNAIANDFETTKELLNTFSSSPLNKSALEKTIFTLSDWILEKKDPQQAITDTISLYQAENVASWPENIQRLFYEYHHEKLSELYAVLMELSSLSPTEDAFSESQNAIVDAIGTIHLLIEKIQLRDLSFYEEIPNTLDFKTKALGKDEVYTEKRKEVETLIKSYLLTYEPLDASFELMNRQVQRLTELFSMANQFNEVLSQLKSDANVLDFSDFEILALRILKASDGTVSELIRAQYKEIMVDEFQDTNEYQDEIIRSISDGTNIFRVGDIKQSIYGFRGAKPQIMQDLINQEQGLNLFLSFNYRSKNDIVEYNNVVFDNLMNLTRNNTYDDNDHVNVGIPSQSQDSEPVELHIIERFDNKDIMSAARQTAHHIAQEILRRHKGGMEFKDMVVLVRSHGSKDFLKEAFEQANIPHFLNELSGFYNSEIITQSIHLLNYALTRSNYYLAFVLTSLYFNMSEDELSELYLLNPNIKESLEQNCPDLNEQLETLIKNWRHQDIVTSISEMIAFNDVYHSVLSIQDKTNLDFLLDKAVLYQSTSTPNLYGFTQFIQEFRDEKSSEASPLSSDANVVSAMTIHQSKGLQFPLVFLFGMGSHTVMNHRNTLITDDEGIGLNDVNLENYRETKKNLLRTLIEFKQDHDEIEEVLRLLYVALTRAQDRLIIVDAIKEIKTHDLNERLLRNHARKIDLLLASSPNNTIIKPIDSYEIGEAVYEGDVISRHNAYTLVPHSIPSSELKYVTNEALNMEDTSEFALAYGTFVHEAVENLPNGPWTDEMVSEYEPSIQTKLMKYNQHPLTQQFFSGFEIHHEMSYIVKDDVIENGIMDFVAISDDKVILVDFKTDNASEALIRERYTDQLNRYIRALHIIYPDRSVQASIYSFHLNDYLGF